MKKDLLVLVADKDAEFALKTLLKNKIPTVEKLREFTFDVISHPQKDSGVYNHVVGFVRPFINKYDYLAVSLDYEGCGHECDTAEKIEQSIEQKLSDNGWDGRNFCVVFEPELESWLWVNQAHLSHLLDWKEGGDIYQWIQENNFEFQCLNSNKPVRPKEVFHALLRKQDIPPSSSLFEKVAGWASYKSCQERSFKKFITKIREWFYVEDD